MKIAVVTCHSQPDYIRAVTLRTAISSMPNANVVIVKNRHLGLLRYPEIIVRLIALRATKRPDVYVVTFRGYEILPFAALLTWPKTLIFDELVNPVEWLSEPRPEFWAKLVPKRLLRWLYRMLVKRCKVVITDTQAHSQLGAATLRLPATKFIDIPVGTDENLFRPVKRKLSSPFQVFYYGNMLPLHGLDIVFEAALRLKALPIHFVIVGGSSKMAAAARGAQRQGARISYQPWMDFDAIPKEIQRSSLCLGGPFGNTNQAKYVITGKTYQFLACGAPVLLGRNKATGLFTNRHDCLLTPLGDAEELARTIEWAFRHPKELEAIGANGRKLYESNFSAKLIAHRVATLFET